MGKLGRMPGMGKSKGGGEGGPRETAGNVTPSVSPSSF